MSAGMKRPKEQAVKQKIVGVAGPARVTSSPKTPPMGAARVTSAPKTPPRATTMAAPRAAVAPRQTFARKVATRVLNGGRSRNR
jgi:hypothetical protein